MSDDRDDSVGRQLDLNRPIREKHDYRRDTAFAGRRLVRLPDRSLIYAEEYEQRLRDYERRVGELIDGLSRDNVGTAIEIASLPETIRGFDLVKEAHLEQAREKEDELVASFQRS